jgi:hypothetical protein
MTLLTLLGPQAAGSDINGTLSKTLGAVTLSGSGTLANGLTGTLSKTLGTATLSASGTLAAGLSGTLSKTLGTLTLVSDGTLTGGGLSGSLSATLGLLTLSSTGTLSGTPVDEGGSKGGWDPYAYKRRNKRRDKIDDVRQFMADILGRDLEDAPPEIIEQAEEAKQAAREVLALAPTGLDTDARAALVQALDEINEFYRLVRERVRLAREADEDEDEDMLLLH